MRKKKVEGEYQTDSWPKGPQWSLCPLARPDIAMGLESQIEAWSAHSSRSLKTPGSHHQIASNGRRTTTVSKSETTCHRLRDDHPAERHGGLGCQGQRHRGGERYTLDIPLHILSMYEHDISSRSLRSLPRDDKNAEINRPRSIGDGMNCTSQAVPIDETTSTSGGGHG